MKLREYTFKLLNKERIENKFVSLFKPPVSIDALCYIDKGLQYENSFYC
jgi:hypothetical protein